MYAWKAILLFRLASLNAIAHSIGRKPYTPHTLFLQHIYDALNGRRAHATNALSLARRGFHSPSALQATEESAALSVTFSVLTFHSYALD